MAESELDDVAALIVADPDANENYLVFADLLMEAGDLRGELIMLQHQLASGGTDRKLRIRGQKLLDNAQAALARAIGTEPSWTWKLGVLRAITIEVGEATDAFVRTLFAHPSARFVTQVAFHEALVRARDTRSHLTTTLAAFAAAAPASVRSVAIERAVTEGVARPANLMTICPHVPIELALPNLRSLALTSNTPVVHGVMAPRLQELVVDWQPICQSTDWVLPSLRSLDWRGSSPYDPPPVRDLCSRKWPALRDLTLRGRLIAGVVNAVALPLIGRLERLCLHASGIDWATFDPRDFDHLETLIVQCPDSFVVPPQAKRLANAVWLRDESLDRTQVGLPPRR